MVIMSSPDLKKALGSRREIEITVTGRTSGRKITLPIWFVSEYGKLLLLPVRGSETNWFRNLKKTPTMNISAGRTSVTVRASPTGSTNRVNDVVEKFRAKYGDADVKKYYTKFDACVEVLIP
jgi:hypothetical protein